MEFNKDIEQSQAQEDQSQELKVLDGPVSSSKFVDDINNAEDKSRSSIPRNTY